MRIPPREMSFLSLGHYRSICELLHSPEYVSLKRAGFEAGQIFIPFPIDNNFRDGDICFFFCRWDSLADRIKGALRPESLVCPLAPGQETAAGALRILAEAQPDCFSFDVALAGHQGSHLIQTATPWSLALAGQAFLAQLERMVAFYWKNDPAASPQASAHLKTDGPLFSLDGHSLETAYRAFTNQPVSWQEMTAAAPASPGLVQEMVRRAGQAGRPELVDSLPYDLVRQAEAIPQDDRFLHHRREAMEQAAQQGDWEGLWRAAEAAALQAPDGKAQVQTKLLRSLAAINLRQYQQAWQELQGISASEQELAQAEMLAACILQGTGQHKPAADLFTNVVNRNTHHLGAVKRLAWSLYRSANYTEAVRVLSYLLKVFDYQRDALVFLLHNAYLAKDKAALNKYAKYLAPYPAVPAAQQEKEWAVLQALLQPLSSGHWMVDVGANTGQTAALLLGWGYPCLCIEPDPAVFQQLGQNLTSHSERAILVQAACSSQEGEGLLRLGLESGFNTLDEEMQKAVPCRFGESQERVPVRLVRLSRLLREHNLADLGLLKMDVEGHEYEVLQGLEPEDLAKFAYVFFEFDLRMPNKLTKVTNHLFQHGFVHGLAFQHSNEDVLSYSLHPLDANHAVLHPQQGACGNILLARQPPFSFSDSLFLHDQANVSLSEFQGSSSDERCTIS